MSNYVKSTNFTSKDSLASGNPLKIVKGAEIDTEFNNIATAVATKADTDGNNATGSWPVSITGSAKKLVGTTWTIEEVSGVLYFSVSGVNKAKLDASGNLTVVGNVTAYGTV